MNFNSQSTNHFEEENGVQRIRELTAKSRGENPLRERFMKALNSLQLKECKSLKTGEMS